MSKIGPVGTPVCLILEFMLLLHSHSMCTHSLHRHLFVSIPHRVNSDYPSESGEVLRNPDVQVFEEKESACVKAQR
jgi:hypothetical protein